MMDVELIITLFSIFLNILIVSYGFKNNTINNSDHVLKTSDSILKKSTNLPIFIVKIVVFSPIVLFFIIISIQLLKCLSLVFSNDILEYIAKFTVFHLIIYLICFLFSKKYNFDKISVGFFIWYLTKIIINLLLQLLS